MKVIIELDTIEDGHATVDQMLKGPQLATAFRELDNELRWIEDSVQPTIDAVQVRRMIRETLDDLLLVVFG